MNSCNSLNELSSIPATPIYFYSIYALALPRKQSFNARTMHIDVRYHQVRNLISSGAIKLPHISSIEQTTEFIKKLMHVKTMETLRKFLVSSLKNYMLSTPLFLYKMVLTVVYLYRRVSSRDCVKESR